MTQCQCTRNCRPSNKCCNNYYLSLWRATLPHILSFSSTWHFPRYLHIWVILSSHRHCWAHEIFSGRHVLCPLLSSPRTGMSQMRWSRRGHLFLFRWKANENKLFLSTSKVSQHKAPFIISMSSHFFYFSASSVQAYNCVYIVAFYLLSHSFR